jgi:ABC-type amino acid transport substrate-binding protein
MKKWIFKSLANCCLASLLILISAAPNYGVEIKEIKERGVLVHLGVPYAAFVTGSGDGFDVELMQLFAKHLGVEYRYVKTSWVDAIPALTGRKLEEKGNIDTPITGDIIANGMTMLPSRENLVDFSIPTFPTQVWLIARSDSSISPIVPSNNIEKDIEMVKGLLKGREVLGLRNTCLDPDLYNLEKAGARVRLFPGSLNELAPAIISGEAETTLLDVPDALIALDKWPGKGKIIGPISQTQRMGCAFAKTSGELRKAFNQFFERCKEDGTYKRLVFKYYPSAPYYFPEFFGSEQDQWINRD